MKAKIKIEKSTRLNGEAYFHVYLNDTYVGCKMSLEEAKKLAKTAKDNFKNKTVKDEIVYEEEF